MHTTSRINHVAFSGTHNVSLLLPWGRRWDEGARAARYRNIVTPSPHPLQAKSGIPDFGNVSWRRSERSCSPNKKNSPSKHKKCQATCSLLHIFVHASHGGLRGEQVAGRVEGDAFAHGAVGGVGLVGRHESRHLAVLEVADADALEPAGMALRSRFGIGDVNVVVGIDGQAAR